MSNAWSLDEFLCPHNPGVSDGLGNRLKRRQSVSRNIIAMANVHTLSYAIAVAHVCTQNYVVAMANVHPSRYVHSRSTVSPGLELGMKGAQLHVLESQTQCNTKN